MKTQSGKQGKSYIRHAFSYLLWPIVILVISKTYSKYTVTERVAMTLQYIMHKTIWAGKTVNKQHLTIIYHGKKWKESNDSIKHDSC